MADTNNYMNNWKLMKARVCNRYRKDDWFAYAVYLSGAAILATLVGFWSYISIVHWAGFLATPLILVFLWVLKVAFTEDKK